MKTVVREIAIDTLALYLLPMIVPGVRIDGGFLTYLMGGAALAIMFLLLRPVLKIISLPINLLTLGLFSFVINAFILYLLTIFISGISVESFSYPAVEIFGISIPAITFPLLFAYIYGAFVLSCIDSFVKWMFR
jgi:putative membrane protein